MYSSSKLATIQGNVSERQGAYSKFTEMWGKILVEATPIPLSPLHEIRGWGIKPGQNIDKHWTTSVKEFSPPPIP